MLVYYDDVTLQDLAAAKGRGQRHVRALFRMAGLPLTKPKQVDLNMRADFLGPTHDMEDALQTGQVNFQPRVGLLVKAKDLIEARLQDGSCTPAQASKIRGVRARLPVYRNVRQSRPRRTAAPAPELSLIHI